MRLQRSWRYWVLLVAVFTLGLTLGRHYLVSQPQRLDQREVVEAETDNVMPTENESYNQKAEAVQSGSQALPIWTAPAEVDKPLVPLILNQENVAPLEVASVQDILLHIEQLKRHDFNTSSTYDLYNATFLANPEIATGLLELLLDMGDPTLQFRTSRLLQHYVDENSDRRLNKYVAEDWVMQQIVNRNRIDEWLDVIKKWGVKSKDNALYLSQQIDNGYSDEQTAAQVWALSRSYLPDYPDTSSFKTDEIKSISDKIAPLLKNENEYLRSAAVRSLKAFRGEGFNKNLIEATEDPSQLVRMTAWVVASESSITNMALLPRALDAMDNESLTTLERGTAYQLIQNFNLDRKTYNRVQRFRSQQNEVVFNREYDEQLQDRLKKLGVDTRYFYEF